MIWDWSTGAAVVSTGIAVIALGYMRADAKRKLQIDVEDLYDSLIERIDEILSVNRNRWNTRTSMYELSGRMESESYLTEQSAWKAESDRINKEIADLRELPSEYSRMTVSELTKQHRILRRIERLYNFETQKQLECTADADRSWQRSQDIKPDYR